MADDFIYLASTSPRRRELLQQIGIRFKTLAIAVPEERQALETPAQCVQRLALEKARAGWNSLAVHEKQPVLGADTAVICDGEMFGKPQNKEHGLAMLQRLSGRSHEVITAVALVGESENTALSVSIVTFREISALEGEAYWHTGEPLDKAGAYAIQGRGAIFVSRLEGSYSGVMGLPLFETANLLQENAKHFFER